jgi:NAD(P)-dependent dehydrogenase (short-subunit alcohol dehydrogenase family)
MSKALMIAADRKIGLEFVKRYSALGWKIIAARRKP